MEPQALVQFSEDQDDDRVFSVARDINPHASLATGHHILVGDCAGNVCGAVVVEFKGGLVEMKIDRTTFRSAATKEQPATLV